MVDFREGGSSIKRPERREVQPLNIVMAGESMSKDPQRPDLNQDRFLLGEEFAGVFDGVGASSDGGRAASLAKEGVERFLSSQSRPVSKMEAEEMVFRAIGLANRTLFNENIIEDKNNQTTGVVGLFWRDEFGQIQFTVAHVGDSRAYIFDRYKQLHQLTLDDTKASRARTDLGEAFGLQRKLSNFIDPNELTEEEANLFLDSGKLTSVLGCDSEVEPNINTLSVQKGESIVIVTDGISHNLRDDEISFVLDAYPNTPQGAVQRLIRSALLRSKAKNFRAKSDDRTAVVVQVL